MFFPDLVIRSRRVVVPGGTRPAALHIRRGKIIGIEDVDDVPAGCPLVDAGQLVVMPGLVDTHVQVNEPERPGSEGFESVTRAAAAGGVTTIIDMPLHSGPATTTLAALEARREAAARKCYVDVGFWGGLVPANVPELPRLFEAGVFGFTCLLAPSGEAEVSHVSENDLRIAMPLLSKIGAPLLARAELSGPIAAASEQRSARLGWWSKLSWISREDRRYSTYLAAFPKEVENQAVALLIQLCREFRTRVHIAPLSSSDALTALYHARSARLPITAETCPHYLYFVADEIPDEATAFTCEPPIRERENRELLWAGLAGGLIQMVVSDHAPASPKSTRLRSGNFMRARVGISSLQLGLSVVWTVASRRGHSLNQLAEWMCRAPARLAGLNRKGAIEVGYDADLVLWDPDATFRVEPEQLQHRHPVAPYHGQVLKGVIERTYLKGEQIYERGRGPGNVRGRLLARQGR